MNRLAIFSAIAKKFRGGELKIIEGLAPKEAKTRILASALRTLTNVAPKIKKFDVLLVPDFEQKTVFRAAANLPKVKAVHPSGLNVYDLLNYKQIFIDKGAVETLAKHYHIS